MKKIEVVAAAIIQDDKVLAAQRGYGTYQGKWEFPGGKIEAGESKQEALRREIQEEMAATIAVGDLAGTIDYDYPDFHLTMHCFFCTVKEGTLKLLEHEGARWLDVGHLHEVDWLPPDLALLPAIKNKIMSM